MTFLPAGDRIRPLAVVTLFWLACVCALLGATLVGPTSPNNFNGLDVTLLTAALLGISIVAARLSHLRMSDIGMMPDVSSPVRLSAGFLFGLLLVCIYAVIASAIANIGWTADPGVSANKIAAAVAGALLFAGLEEVIFRGYAFRRLAAAYGLWPAQLIVAGAFIIYHVLMGWPVVAAVIGTSLGSLLFGMAAIASRGLAVPIGIHAAWNFGMWAIGTRELPAVWQMVGIDLTKAALANGVAYSVAAVAGILVLWLWYRRVGDDVPVRSASAVSPEAVR